MDEKAKVILTHYKQIIEDHQFTEYDVLGFLIFIRSHVNRYDFKNIYEFMDLIAHRKRSKGIVMDDIRTASENSYEMIEGTNRIKGYFGICTEEWEKEWEKLGKQFGLLLTKSILLEITMCIYSLAQSTIYKDNSVQGELLLFHDVDGHLSLNTKETKERTKYILFAKYGKYSFTDDCPVGIISHPVETKRIGIALQLLSSNGVLLAQCD